MPEPPNASDMDGSGIADERLRTRLLEIPLAFLEHETGLSRDTIVRARRGQPVHPRSLQLLKNLVRKVSIPIAVVRTRKLDDLTGSKII